MATSRVQKLNVDFDAIRLNNLRDYGLRVGEYGKKLLAERYDNRVHFIFELLQNAEDALRRRSERENNIVQFELSKEGLKFSHYGQPFDAKDVEALCGIGRSTKEGDEAAIGKFGIGFKAVYSYTDHPEIHSGNLHFVIESFVWPKEIPAIALEAGQTIFWFPFRPKEATETYQLIEKGLSELELSTLLFLRQISEIQWRAGTAEGAFVRKVKLLGSKERRIVLRKKSSEPKPPREEWLVFDRPVGNGGRPVGWIEIAFRIENNEIVPVDHAKLAVFFPTEVGLEFGAVCQGPYRTTPSRDNIHKSDAWNLHLITETAALMEMVLLRLKSLELLGPRVFGALPIAIRSAQANELFKPVFDATVKAFSKHSLVPVSAPRGHAPAGKVRIGRTKEIRELLSSRQLAKLMGEEGELYWVIDELSGMQHPLVRRFLITDLNIPEIDPSNLAPRLNAAFLAEQSDAWMLKFYAFLRGQEALLRPGAVLATCPFIRLENGAHVVPLLGTRPCAFLPSDISTGFPTIKASLCESKAAAEFFRSLGLSEPDPVDDIVENVLPKYSKVDFRPSDAEYSKDLAMITAAYKHTDSKKQQEKLVTELRKAPFLATTIEGAQGRTWRKPELVYQSTERLRGLFADVKDVAFVDNSVEALRRDDARDLLEACGTSRYLIPILPDRAQTRMYSILSLPELLAIWSTFDQIEAEKRARFLWEALVEFVARRGESWFSSTRTWFFRTTKSEVLDSEFVALLRETPWVAWGGHRPQKPEFVIIEEIQPPWDPHIFLQKKIPFKPREVAQLAERLGLEPKLLDYLKQHGLTNIAELEKRLVKESTPAPVPGSTELTTPVDELASSSETGAGEHRSSNGPGGNGTGGGFSHGGGSSSGSGGKTDWKMVSYAGLSPIGDGDDDDTDGLTHDQRMDVERKAIAYIREKEGTLKTTSACQPGFDLYEGESTDTATRFVEVKSKKGPWVTPVIMSVTQFRKALAEGKNYWLYVVEEVGEPSKTKLHRIQDPSGLIQKFAFDRGWADFAKGGITEA